jgi:hypothetical protein
MAASLMPAARPMQLTSGFNPFQRSEFNTAMKTAFFKISALVLLGATLTACGDGSSYNPTSTPTPTPTPTPAPTLADLQGFWNTTLNETIGVGAVILPDGQAWLDYGSSNGINALAQVSLSINGNTYTGTGKYYNPLTGAVQDYSVSGTIKAAEVGATLVNSITVGTDTPITATWTYVNTYATAATQSSIQGHWTGALNLHRLSWDIDVAGGLTGTSTTGCSYSGTIKPDANPVAVFDVAIAESCAGISKTLAGIATVNEARNGMFVAYTTGTCAQAQGGILNLDK